MFFQILSASLFLPFLITGMIIAQVHLEKYWDDNINKPRENSWSIFYIIFIYLAQEICIMELTLQNLNIIAFTFVIPITMILRNRHKLWWGLLVTTPLITFVLDFYLKRYQFMNLGAALLQLSVVALTCAILLRFPQLPYYLKYGIALYSSCFIHIVRLIIEHELKTSFIITTVLGSFFIILAETSRRYYEHSQNEQIAELHYENIRDDLTGLLNYRAFDQDMRNLSKEDATPILIAILDIDHFKKVNDTYGHLNGNVVLHAFSEKLRLMVHYAFDPNCAVYRFGGEEFTIVIKSKDYKRVIELLNHINNYFADHPVKTPDGHKIPFSFSGGLTEHLKNETFTQTLARADTLVYKAKSLGRKRILFKAGDSN